MPYYPAGGGDNYWQRAGIIVSPTTAGDSVSLGSGILRNAAYASLIDANAKFLPVEILGTNLPAGKGAFLTDGMLIAGQTGATKGNILFDTSVFGGGYEGLIFRTNTANIAGVYTSATEFILYNYLIGISSIRMNASGIIANFYQNGVACTFLQNISLSASKTVDGLDLSEYQTTWRTNYQSIVMAAEDYTAFVAGDIGRRVDGTVTGQLGILCEYNNTTRTIIVATHAGSFIAANPETITAIGGTGTGTTNALGDNSPARKQITKAFFGELKCTPDGLATIYLTSNGQSTGTALFTGRIIITGNEQTATPVTPVGFLVSADKKSIGIQAMANAYIHYQGYGEV
jgi:hypothetical protein